MPIALDDAQNHHPLMLTRQANPDQKPLEGEFTLEQLQFRFALAENTTEDEVLADAAAHGHAFFKRDGLYVGFAPLPGDSEDLPVDPIAPEPETVSLEDYEIFDDVEDPEDEELEVGLTASAAELADDADPIDDDLPEALSPETFSDETTALPADDAPDDLIF